MFVLMKPGVTRLNFLSLLSISFLTSLILYVKASMLSLLLVADYGISKHDSGATAANLGIITDLFVLPSEFVLGFLNDMIGRKKIICGGLLLCGTALILMT